MKKFGFLMAAVLIAAASAFGQQKVVTATQSSKAVANDSVKIEKCERRACDKVVAMKTRAHRLKCDSACANCEKHLKCAIKSRDGKVCRKAALCEKDSLNCKAMKRDCCKAKADCCKANADCKKAKADCCKAKGDCKKAKAECCKGKEANPGMVKQTKK